jgi:nicotinamidase/pyrazinamidase
MSDTSEKKGKTAVILVDFQADFTEFKKGSLAASGTNETYVETVIQATRHLHSNGFKIFATQDWHPVNHMSFSVNNAGTKPFDMIDLQGRSQIMWPTHCVQDTPGAELLIQNEVLENIVQKGTDPDFDSYSGFADDGGKKTELDKILKKNGIEQLIIYGLATDFCVRFTVLDAVTAGYKVKVFTALCRGVAPDTTEAAIAEMREKGVLISEKDPSCR